MKNAVLNSLTHARLKNLFVALLTLCSSCLLPSAQGSVTVDQVPLTVQSPIAPNIVLMLDDSGSMGWNFMPDLCTNNTSNLAGVTCSGGNITSTDNDALTNANNNGVYYNPATTYSPPIKADGTSYPNSPGLTTAYANGFTNTATSIDLTAYSSTTTFSGSSNYNYTGAYELDFNNNTAGKSNVASSTSTSAISATCPSGYSISNRGTYLSPDYECSIYGTQTPSCSAGGYNSTTGSCDVPPTPVCASGFTLTGTGASTTCSGFVTAPPTCPSSGSFNSSTGLCTVAPKSCGSGYTLKNIGTTTSPNYQCQSTSTSTPTCTPTTGTYSSSTGTCTVSPPTASCSSGTIRNIGTSGSPNYQCQATATPTCSPNTGTYSSSTGSCTLNTPPSASCSSGTIRNIGTSGSPNYQCQATAAPTCSPNTGTYNSGTGSCTLNTPPAATCSSGTIRNIGTSGSPNYQCQVTATPGCTPNIGSYNASSGTCTANAPPAPTCSSGVVTNMGTSGSPNYKCAASPTCPASGSYGTIVAGACTTTTSSCSSSYGTGWARTDIQSGSGVNYQCTKSGNPNKTPLCTTAASSAGYIYNSTLGSTSTGYCTYTPPTTTPSCATNYNFSSTTGGCVAISAPAPSCAAGFTLTGTGSTMTCASNTTSGPNCGTNYSFNTGTNACVANPTPTPACGTGFTLTGTGSTMTCASNTTTAPNCATNYSFNTGTNACVANPTPTPACGTGFTLTGTGSTMTCASNTTSGPNCGTNFSFNTATNVCVANPFPTPSCGSGLTLIGSGSSMVCATVKTATCPSGGYSYNSTISGSSCSLTASPSICPSGYSGIGLGTTLVCSKPTTATPTCASGSYNASGGICLGPTPTCSTSSYSVTNTGTSAAPVYQCAGYTTTTANCSSGTYSSTLGQCSVTGTPTKNFFQFTTGPAAGPYVNYYVASTAQGCVNIPHSSSSSNCVTENDTSGVAAPSGIKAGQNIANWFSYYHTRLLTAKSGLTTAFDKLDPSSRLGFSSINGNNNSALPSSTYTSGSVKVATVSAFDRSCVTDPSPCTKGTTGTQRAAFWSWVVSESSNNSTPLRSALNAIGQYYSQNAPWQTSSTDTTRLACRQAYTIATTDGFWNDPTPPSPGNVDNTNGTQITGPNGQAYTYTAVVPFKDATANTLADVAMKYWSTDLQTDVDNEVPTGSADPAFWQHMTTFTLGLGFTPTGITPAGTTMDQVFVWANGADSSTGTKTNGNVPTDFAWPVPASNSVYNIADLAHAAVNGHGGFYSATSPKAFSDGISDALNRVQSRTGTGASLAANSTKLGVGTVTYQALYYTVKWTGDLKAYNVDPTSGAISASPTWTASTVLPAASSRTIMTYNPSGSTSATKYVAFSDPAALSTAQKTALGSTATIQQNVINYLRGDSSLEANKSGGTFRIRSTPLGDIINSQPVYVGTPNPNLFYGKTFTGSDSYPDFAATNISRTAVIWVAANDGMLHAFRTSDGVEVYAYIPGAVITNNLANLANVNYGGSAVPHQFYNDGEMTVADVYTTLPSGTTAGWRTVLVGNTGRGPAKAIYALDITDPTAPIFLWERSAADGLTNSGYMGQVTGQPVIAQTANGTWSVLVGNGYNSTQNKAALLQFDLMTGTLTVHATDNTADNGLAAPLAWIGTLSNDISTVAYAGDLKGRVWSFTLFDTTLSTPAATPSSSGSVVFTTSDGGTKAQPITAGLLAGKDPSTGNLWLFFGTGQYMTQNDLSNRDVQSWYGIIVQSSDSTLPTQLASWTGSRTAGTTNALVPRSITVQQDATSTTLAARAITVPTNGDMLGKSGWFLDLVKPPSSTAQGERMVTPNQFQGSLLLGTSRVPIVSDPCNPSGSGWIMAVNPFTGGNPSSLFFDLNGDQHFNSTDQVNGIPAGGIGFGSVANNPIFVGNTMLTSFDNGTISSLDTAGTIGAVVRLSWRELVTH